MEMALSLDPTLSLVIAPRRIENALVLFQIFFCFGDQGALSGSW